MKILVLFDLDGTLAHTQNTDSAWEKISQKVYGIPWNLPMPIRSGKTEPESFIYNAKMAGISEDEARKKVKEAMSELAKEFRSITTSTEIPGARKLLERLRDMGIPCGIFTGCSKARTDVKLEKSGLKEFFEFGGYGDDAETKEEMFQHALARAEKLLGKRYRHKDVVVIGDAPMDVKAGKHWGAKTIAVNTGHVDEQLIKDSEPDHFFEDLTETDKVIEAIIGHI